MLSASRHERARSRLDLPTKRFSGTLENAAKRQGRITVPASVLAAVQEKRLNSDTSLCTLRQIPSAALSRKMPLPLASPTGKHARREDASRNKLYPLEYCRNSGHPRHRLEVSPDMPQDSPRVGIRQAVGLHDLSPPRAYPCRPPISTPSGWMGGVHKHIGCWGQIVRNRYPAACLSPFSTPLLPIIGQAQAALPRNWSLS